MSLYGDYLVKEGYPSPPTYLHLRESAGLSPKTALQAASVAAGSWYGVTVTHSPTNTVVGMGRVIGDGAWYFHIVDMAVLPGHQRRGLGDAILAALLKEIELKAPSGPYVNLVADGPGRNLYAKHGFVETAPRSVAMEKR
jgi:ribosomal protein S18 acetylase RimI-like enzyme